MVRVKAVDVYVSLVVLGTTVAMTGAWYLRATVSRHLGTYSLIVVSFLLDRSPMELRVSAQGSTSFVVHLSAGALFGGFWGGLVAAIASLATSLSRGLAPERVLFNPAQRALSVVLGAFVYQAFLGGSFPPSFLLPGHAAAADVQRDLFLFFVLASTYVIVNKLLVAGAVSLSSDRPFREVWHLNARGMLGYDLGASVHFNVCVVVLCES